MFKAKSIVGAALVLPVVGFAAADESKPETVFGARALAISGAVLQHHIDPPTQQQMVLDGVKALYREHEQPMPRGLSRRISNLAGDDELAGFLAEIGGEFDDANRAEAILTKGILAKVPGGGRVVPSEDDRIAEQIRENRYVGIGIVLAMDGGRKLPMIPKVFYNGPAWNAGAKANDLILEVDGQSTKSIDLKQVVELLRGEEGSEVTVVVQQPGNTETRELTMTRTPVFIPTIEGFREKSPGHWQYAVESAPEVGLLRFKSIGPSTLRELREIERRLRQEKIRGVILDLRSGGSTLHDVVLLADALLDGGVIGHVRTHEKLETHEARPGALLHVLPLVVLVGPQTSPGPIYLTAALQDHGRAIVVGQPTAYDIYVRSQVDLSDGDKLVLATGILHRADGTPLVGRGKNSFRPADNPPSEAVTPMSKKASTFILPDHVVQASHHMPSGKDATLTKGVDVLRTVLGIEQLPDEGDAITTESRNTPRQE